MKRNLLCVIFDQDTGAFDRSSTGMSKMNSSASGSTLNNGVAIS
jgi:hypothetical protein